MDSASPCAEGLGFVTHGSNQPSHQKPGTEVELLRNDLQQTLMSNGMKCHGLLGTPTRLLRMLYQQNHHQPGLKGAETGQK